MCKWSAGWRPDRSGRFRFRYDMLPWSCLSPDAISHPASCRFSPLASTVARSALMVSGSAREKGLDKRAVYDGLLIWTLMERPDLSCGLPASLVWLAKAGAFPSLEFSCKISANAPETGRNLKKMLKTEGTNSTSPLESAKVSKKRTQTNWKRTGKTRQKHAKKAKTN